MKRRIFSQLNSSPARAALLSAALIAALPGPGLATSRGSASDLDAVFGIFGGPGLTVCQRTAEIAVYLCRQELNNESLLNAAKANNLEDEEERAEALQEIAENRPEGSAACFEQRQARLELCEALDENRYDPDIDPADFAHPIGAPNPYFPLVPGTRFIYEGETEEGSERVEVTITDETFEILGVVCTVVLDQVFVDGELVEDTRDYFAQDLDGNVWYFGESTIELVEDGTLNVEGSWIGGVDGAQPGLFMPALPEVGDAYRQEFSLGEAEDAARVLSLDAEVEIGRGSFSDCLQTEETTPLEPDALEHKFYAPGVGFVLQVDLTTNLRLELVEIVEPEP